METAWGKFSSYNNHYNEGVWTLRETSAPRRTWKVRLRAYDTGVTLHYEFPKNSDWPAKFAVTGERTEFRFAADGTAWCYNGEHDPAGPQPLSKFSKGTRPPLGIELAPDLTAAVLEAAIFLAPGSTYSATIFEEAPDAHFKTNREAYRIRTATVKRGDTIQAKMAPGGGHCIKLALAETGTNTTK